MAYLYSTTSKHKKDNIFRSNTVYLCKCQTPVTILDRVLTSFD